MNDEEICGTHETNAVAKNCVGREGMQHNCDRYEPLKQSGITPPRFFKRLGLLLEYIKDRFGAVATIDPCSEWVGRSSPVSLQYFAKAALKSISRRGHGIVGEMPELGSGRESGSEGRTRKMPEDAFRD